ncbi:unnamed protein product [Citrullus colocynthis]|uniref:Uncharacterized protein n=1 Tax=Citrullus colocynthis TaxID=252529 RepID=A0ABP0XYX5_9ROSI
MLLCYVRPIRWINGQRLVARGSTTCRFILGLLVYSLHTVDPQITAVQELIRRTVIQPQHALKRVSICQAHYVHVSIPLRGTTLMAQASYVRGEKGK